jgi:hypothetical protein
VACRYIILPTAAIVSIEASSGLVPSEESMHRSKLARFLLPLSFLWLAAAVLALLAFPILRACLRGRNPDLLAGAPTVVLIAGVACQVLTLFYHKDRLICWITAFLYLIIVIFLFTGTSTATLQ